ncbi:MAG: ribonuclease catalytic domain-containing protein [Caldimicrobium sp.]
MSLEKLIFCVVDVYYKDKITTAYVKEVKGKKLHLLLPSGKEELLSHQALLSLGKSKISLTHSAQIEEFLKEKQALREKIKEELELKELWEVIAEDLDKSTSWELMHLLLGRVPTCDEVAGFMRKVVEDRIYFSVEGPDLVKVRSKEEVKNLLIQKEKELKRLQLIAEGDTFLQAVISNKLETFPEERKTFWIELLKQYVLYEESFEQGKLLKEILQKNAIDSPTRLVELLAKKNIINEDWFYELEKLHFPTQFSQKALKEAELILSQSYNFSKHLDLTNLFTFTIDAKETEDFDDALSIEKEGSKFILYVHITEVARYINPNMALWEEALERASTLYLPETIYPMFPFSLSHGKFSLREGEIKPVMTFKFTLSKEGDVESCEIFSSLVRIKKRFTYEEVDKYLEAGEPFWREFYQIFKPFKEYRSKNGAFAVILPEIQIRVLPNGEILCQKIEMTPARDLVAEAMILANFYGAKFMIEKDIPTIFRSQKMPFQIIEIKENSLYHQILQLKFMSKSELSLEPAYHSGLGLPHYTTLTSPIRRFLDLLTQWQLLCYLEANSYLSKEEVFKILSYLQQNLQRAQFLQNRRKKYYLLKYLKLYKSEDILKGIILDTQGRKYKVYLPDFNLTGEALGYKGTFNAGDEVRVKLEKVNPYYETLRLTIL